MPLQITKTNRYGTTASYWRIDQLVIDRRNQQIAIAIGGYATSVIAAVPGNDPLMQNTFTLQGGGYNTFLNTPNDPAWNTIGEVTSIPIYNHLKTLPFFAGATDVA